MAKLKPMEKLNGAVPASPLAMARSLLFVPATRPDRIAKAFLSGADAVIVDLEDGVARQDKNSARCQMAQAAGTLPVEALSRLMIRVNPLGSAWHDEDVKAVCALMRKGLGGVMLPKVESSASLATLSQEFGSDAAIVPLIESVAGLDALDSITSVPNVLRLAFGHLDFQTDAGLFCGINEEELLPVRLSLVFSSRRASLPPPIDSVTVDIKDVSRLQRDTERARRGGFGGKLCIHPAQVPIVNAALAPSSAEVAKACRVVEACESSEGGVFALDGGMVDAPVLRQAQRTLAQAAMMGKPLD